MYSVDPFPSNTRIARTQHEPVWLQSKAFPSEDELVDRLDNNFQWVEFKRKTVGEFLVARGKLKADDVTTTTLELPAS